MAVDKAKKGKKGKAKDKEARRMKLEEEAIAVTAEVVNTAQLTLLRELLARARSKSGSKRYITITELGQRIAVLEGGSDGDPAAN